MILGVSISTSSLFLVMGAKLGRSITTYPTGNDQLFIFGMHVAFMISAALLVIADLIVIQRWFVSKKKRKN